MVKRQLHEMRCITRFDFKRTRGWLVRIQRQSAPHVQKLFSDRRFGGMVPALRAAKAFRDEADKRAPAAAKGQHTQLRDGSIYRRTRTYRAPDGSLKHYDAFEAYIMIAPGRRAMTNWSVSKWGEKKAREEVEKWLTRMREEQARNFGVERIQRPAGKGRKK